MAEDTKKIAKLDFNIDKALSGLDKIDAKLKTISESSEKYAKNIGLAINNGVDYKTIAKSIGLTENQLRQLTKTAQKEAIITREKREREEIKTTEVLKREHAKQEQSVKTLYDKIANYAGTYLIYQGFNVLKRSIGEVIDEMVDLESSMVQIDRVLNESSLDIDNYRDKLMQTAYDYGNSMSNVADITLRLAQAGFDSNEALKLTEKTLLALNTAELNATQATDDMVAVMAQWGWMTGDANEEARQYGEIIDKINKVADNFPTTSADIMDALKKVSSAFNLAGADIDETIATIVAAEKASQRGGKVIGTALSNIVQQIKAEGKLNLAEELGLNFFKDAKKTEFKPIMEIFQEMSDRMATLKKEGKESSVEMQQMLELFTVFRRNIGASLLGEMEGGENSTYMRVYETALNSVGYSIQENAKYMATAKAAQEQFNVALLQLKTSVWDSGVEDVYKSMLVLGRELIDNIGVLVDKFGGIPTVVGAATLAFSLLNKNMRVAKFDIEKSTIELTGFAKEFKNLGTSLKTAGLPKALKETADVSNISFKTMISNITAFDAATLKATVKTLALKAATVSLNLAATAAATAGMMLLTSIIQELINKEAAAIQLQESSIQSTEKQISAREDEITNLNELIKRYDDLATKTKLSPEETTELYEIQVKIKNILGDQADTIDLINGKYEKQKQKLNELTQEQRKQLLEDKKKLMEQKQYEGVNVALPSAVQSTFGDKNYEKVIMQYGGTGLRQDWKGDGSLKETLDNSTIEEAIELFTKWEENLRSVQGESVELANTYNWVNTTLNSLTEKVKESDDATRDYYETLASVKLEELFPEDSITSAEQYSAVLNNLQQAAENSTGDFKIFQDTLVELFMERFSEFAEQTQNVTEQINGVAEANEYVISKLEGLANQYSILEKTQKELNDTGNITISTFKSLVDNNLLQYLDVVNGKIVVNTGNMAAMAEETKIAAIESLKAAASEDIHKLALGKEADMSVTAKNAIANFGNSAANAGGKARTAAGAILELASALAQAAAANSELAGENNVSDFSAKASAISGAYQSAAKKIGAISISSASSSGRSSGGGRTGSTGKTSTKDTKKEKEEEKKKKDYEKRLEYFTNTIDRMESKEEEWVNKQKELGLLSNSDMVYITKRRIKEYEAYLKKIKNATWMNKEDRKKMQDEYTKKLKEAQLDYFNYLKEKLEDETKAIEESRDERIKALEEEIKKKKQLIEDEADARIAALKKVSDTRDRKREEEDYKKERQEILDEIAYWQQRTGREAVENLANAKQKLKELDEDWKEKVEDWNTDDLIKSIEQQRDAQIEALEAEAEQRKKNIEDEAQLQIDALKATYDSKVKAFSESNQIIYDDSVIAAKNLYNAYKTNFVEPLKEDLKYINKKDIKYTVKKGDTLESIAKEIKKTTGEKVSTIIKRIKKANSSLKNTKDTAKLKKGTKIKIPMYHQGGIFSGTEEGLALLKKGEWVLRPEWSQSMNRMMKYFDNVTQGKANGISNNSTIEVSGNLVNIQATVRNQSDIDAIGQKVEKILKDKFNIKK